MQHAFKQKKKSTFAKTLSETTENGIQDVDLSLHMRQIAFTITKIAFYGAMVMISIAIVATSLGLHSEYNIVSQRVTREYDRAKGTLTGSTCRCYNNELTPEEKVYWGPSARLEGDAHCVSARAYQSQIKWIVVWKELLYHYLPYKENEFWTTLQTMGIVVFSGIIPAISIINRCLNFFNPPIVAVDSRQMAC